jgi:aromatic-L-amino-acid decarboxylase
MCGAMTPEDFRTHGKQMVDWIADYWENIEQFPVKSQVSPGWVRNQLSPVPPESPETYSEIMGDVDSAILPGITHWQHPGFHAYFNSGGSAPSVLGDLLSSGFSVQGMIWATSPAATELETLVLDWLIELLDLPRHFLSSTAGGGVIQDSASSATLSAILAAREQVTSGAVNREGLGSQKLTAYASAHAHSSIEKGLRIAGLGSASLRLIPVDERYALNATALRETIEADLAAGHLPMIVVANVGTTSSTAIDPVADIGAICKEFGVWLHVDAALAGTAALLPEMRWIHDGVELADSYVFNPHKWMLTSFDASCLWVKDRSALIGAFEITPEYLQNAATDTGSVIDYRDWQVPMGRRFRALKLWFVIRSYGASGLRTFVEEHLRLTRLLASWVSESADFSLAAPHPVNLVCFKHNGGDAANRTIMDRINADGKSYLTHTVLSGDVVLRAAIGGERTQQRHIEQLWAQLEAAAAELP